jgi:cell cycle sensor histidine kinase DivJ
MFRPSAEPDKRMALSLRRRGEDGLVALVRETGPVHDPEKAEALWKEQVARTVAETRVQVLETRLRNTETARNQAFNALTEAKAAAAGAEKARDAAEAGAVAKSRFLANMSHELRTPLNAIMGFSDIMRQRMFGDLSAKYGEYAELIHESGRHLTDLINDVLDMSKIEAERYTLSREVFDAREPVNAALRLVRLQADEAGVQLRGVLPQEPLGVDADRRALKQIVLNLVSNALKFTPRGGSVTVTLDAVGDALELVVADTGVGIAKEDLERLGRPFEQAGDAGQKAKGTGLGLSLVRAFAQLHGGEMSIESALGEGAVTVRLPVLERPEPQPSEPPAPAAGAEVIPLNRLR